MEDAIKKLRYYYEQDKCKPHIARNFQAKRNVVRNNIWTKKNQHRMEVRHPCQTQKFGKSPMLLTIKMCSNPFQHNQCLRLENHSSVGLWWRLQENLLPTSAHYWTEYLQH